MNRPLRIRDIVARCITEPSWQHVWVLGVVLGGLLGVANFWLDALLWVLRRVVGTP